MPIFDYECTNEECGHVFEVVQNIRRQYAKKCPKCDAKAKKTYANYKPGIIFKGDGWTKQPKPDKT